MKRRGRAVLMEPTAAARVCVRSESSDSPQPSWSVPGRAETDFGKRGGVAVHPIRRLDTPSEAVTPGPAISVALDAPGAQLARFRPPSASTPVCTM
jgi:hypothetical protein